MRNINDLNKGAAIHCKTEQEWRSIIDLHNHFTENGRKFWYTRFEYAKENSVYYPKYHFGTSPSYGSLGWAKQRGIDIYPASDFLTETKVEIKQLTLKEIAKAFGTTVKYLEIEGIE